jgi:hypothetical protein
MPPGQVSPAYWHAGSGPSGPPSLGEPPAPELLDELVVLVVLVELVPVEVAPLALAAELLSTTDVPHAPMLPAKEAPLKLRRKRRGFTGRPSGYEVSLRSVGESGGFSLPAIHTDERDNAPWLAL